MSVTLIVMVPFVLLGIVTLLGFVGCGYPDFQFGDSFTTYSKDTVLNNVQCKAYWPLNDAADATQAKELVNGNNGDYLNMTTAISLYPWMADAGNQSAAATGKFLLQQPGLVEGDQVNGVRTPCMVVDGALVKVDNKMVFNPIQFTVEAWVRVDWASTDAPAIRMVIDSRDSGAVGTGFAIAAIPESDGTYHWNAIVGNGPGQPTDFTFLKATDSIALSDAPDEKGGQSVYLAMTVDGSGNLTLYVNGTIAAPAMSGVTYTPNTTQPLYIGAGGAFAGLRGQGGLGPLWPFVGAIQDVAIYDSALLSGDISNHATNGGGDATG